MSRVLPHLLSALAGTLSHIFYFKKGEHHANGSQYAKVFTGVFAAATALLHFTQSIAWDQASLTVCKFFLSYAIGLYSSLIIYRIFFHPLRKFPGPFFAGISSAWQPLAVNDQNNFRLLHRLHQKYGPFVRYGSSDLSITNPEAVPAIYGTGSPCIKGDWYDLSAPATSLQTFRDTKLHSQRRRVWSNAFSEKMVRGYEQRIKSYRQKLVDQLTIMDGQAVNIRKWLFLYGYDVMGDLAFGKGFDMLETGDQPWAVKLTNDAMDTIGLFLPTWLFMLMAAIPGLARGFWRYLDYCAKRLDRRMQTKVDVPDISSVFISALEGRKPDEADLNLLSGDARLIIIAGSDTTTTTLAGAFYQLAHHPEHIEKLRAELAPYVDPNNPTGDIDGYKIAHLDHLNGILNETLRLFPVAPSTLPRKTPLEGLEIDGVYIPGEMTVTCPQWTLGRSEAIYEKADQFIPERWYKYPEMVKNRSAYAPFSIGPYNCIGKPLALLNMRNTLSRLVMTFDFTFAPGHSKTEFEDNMKDKFVLYPGDLYLTLHKRG